MPVSLATAAISGGLGLIGSSKQSKAAEAAAGMQSAAAAEAAAVQRELGNRSLDLQERIYQQNRADLDPYRKIGANALAVYGQQLGLNVRQVKNPLYTPPGAEQVTGNRLSGPGDVPSSGNRVIYDIPKIRQIMAARFPMDNGEQSAYSPVSQGGLPDDQVLAEARSAGVNVDFFSRPDTAGGGVQQGAAPGSNALSGSQPEYILETTPSDVIDPIAQAGENINALTKDFRASDQFDLLGLSSAEDFKSTPGYKFRLTEGLSDLNNSLTASGLSESGDAMRALEEYRQNLATDEYSRNRNFLSNTMQNYISRGFSRKDAYLDRMAALAGVEQTGPRDSVAASSSYAAGASGTLGRQASGISNALQTGAARAGQYTADAGYYGGAGFVGAANSLNRGYENYLAKQFAAPKITGVSSGGAFGVGGGRNYGGYGPGNYL